MCRSCGRVNRSWLSHRTPTSNTIIRVIGRPVPGHPRLLRAREANNWMPGTSPGMTKVKETRHETRRPHRKTARHQAREGLELEAYLRTDGRLFRSAALGRPPTL